jgi:serine/threonine protein kinase
MRGRLLNRVVALKKVRVDASIATRAEHTSGQMEVVDTSKKRTYAHLAESTSLHQSLHHPSILSLFSTFSSRSATYHVLELCAKGTLSDFIRSRSSGRLTEAETRGVMRSLVDALVYLRKRLVLHRDIKAGNVLLTDGYRIVDPSTYSFDVLF